ncbi:MAG: hypothetical protein IJZ17_03355, partial [Muribaculaceae bacterium]|nr:hypothetical protein [Muribaculaceae bacterium]
ALLACGWPNNKNYKWSDARKLMEYGLENYAYRSVEEQIELPRVEVMDGVAEDGELFKKAYAELEVDYGSDIDFSYLLRKDEKIEVLIEYEENLEAPLNKGQKIGTKTSPFIISASMSRPSLLRFRQKFPVYLEGDRFSIKS